MKQILYILFLSFGLCFITKAQSRSNNDLPKLLKYYPNPATSSIYFDFTKGYDRTYSLQIFNFMGKRVAEIKNLNSSNYVNIDDYYRGIYIFQLRDKNGSIIESGKFQVIH